MNAAIDWIPAGQSFSLNDLVFWQGKDGAPFNAVAARIDTIVLGPHASARFPAELQPFVDAALTRRKQYDYSDVITSSLGRAWAAADPGVVFVENPHSRLVLDPNRAPPADVMPGLREFFSRLEKQHAGEKVTFGGIDAVRPITFSGEAVLRPPKNDVEWTALQNALATSRRLGPQAYRDACDNVISTVLKARKPGTPLRVISLHDTMNTKMRADGAIVVERPAADRLPALVNFGNKGDERGERETDPVTIGGAELRRIADAWAQGFGFDAATRVGAITLNSPYKGAFETVHYGANLAALNEPVVGAVQVEFLRETLLGPRATAHLQQPGTGWPELDRAHLDGIVTALVTAGRLLR
jgi:N-formylglutamate amidohydrolase